MFYYTEFANDPESSVIDMAWYDEDQDRLMVQFVETQRRRVYHGVDRGTALGFLDAMNSEIWSTGRYYNQYVKNRFQSDAAYQNEYQAEQRPSEEAEEIAAFQPVSVNEYTVTYAVANKQFVTRVGAESDNLALDVLFKSFSIVGLDKTDVQLVKLERVFPAW